MMDNNNWRPAQNGVAGAGEQPAADGDDWRKLLPPESRHRIVNKIMDTLKRHLPFSGPEGLNELKKIAVRFEEKIFHAALNQPDYLRKISLKMLTMENKSQNPVANAMPTGSAGNSSKPPDPGMQPQLPNPGASMANQIVGNQSQVRQQLLSQNIQNNMSTSGVQGNGSINSSLPPVSGMNQTSLPNLVNQNTNMRNMPNVSQNLLGNSMGQGLASNMFVNQGQMQGRQQLVTQQQQQQQPQNQQQFLYQQQMQNQIMKQKLQQGNIPQSMMPSHMQQAQQAQQSQPNMLQPSQIQPPQQSVMQSSAVMQPSGMQATPLPGLQQNQQPSIQQTPQPMIQQHQQPGLRHQTQPQQSVHQQQQMIQSQQQQPNMQQGQMINQQNNMGDMQQPQQRMLNQQNNLQNFQQQQPQQQQLISQQNNLSNLHPQQMSSQTNVSGMHQQQSVMTQSGNSGMQVGQHSVHMLQQPKVSIQQQIQNGSPNLLPGQQPQLPPAQQQLMSQMQPQAAQLQQQMGLQQQQASLQRDVQQRLPGSGSLLQPTQNGMDQQKQMYPNQRNITEAPAIPLDSTAQAGQANGVDWQEEIYQKIKSMKDLYLQDLTEMYQRIATKVQQHESLPQQPKSEQLEKLKIFKAMLERLSAMLQITKGEIHHSLKDKLPSYEKQIVSFLNTNRPKRLPGQLPPQHMPSMQPQASQPQGVHGQANENQMNPQMQSMNVQGSGASMQQNNMNSIPHNSMSSFPGVSNPQQMMNSLQPNVNAESGQGNMMNSMQQVTAGSMQQNPVSAPQQNPVSAPQQVNVSAISSQGGLSVLQPNGNSLQGNSNIHQQNLKQHQEQQVQQQLKQQYQRQFLLQQKQQQQQQLMQQQQQLNQVKQQQPSQLPTQLQNSQLSQLQQNGEVNEVKIRPGMGPKPGVFQQHHSTTGQRPAYPHQQLKPGFPISSPQHMQALSPQIPQYSSPQIDQHNLLPALTKMGTPLQSASSPFVVPSPSTPLAPSPMPADLENQKPASGLSSVTNAGNLSHQHTAPTPAIAGAQSLAIGTPGMSASPLLAEYGGLDGAHGGASTALSGKSTVTELPIERLMRAVKSAAPQTLCDAVNDIGSVVSMVDRIAGSAPGNGSRAAIGEDLVAMTKCRMQARNFIMQDGPSGTKKIRRCTSAMPLNVAYSAGSMTDSFKQLMGVDASDLESTASSRVKRSRSKGANHALKEEIREINQRLIDTVVDICDEDVDPTAAAAVAEGSEGVIVKCSFNAVSLSPGLKSQYGSAQLSPIQPLRLLVPSNYPKCSPLLLDKFPVEISKEYEDLSSKAKSRFSICLRGLSQPMSLKDIARTWGKCSRAVILEYAEQSGGGSFSSIYGAWENIQTVN